MKSGGGVNGSKGEESMAHIVNLRHAPALRAALHGKPLAF